jgi:hypothetical protein
MGCPICDNKPANCDCTATEREQFDEIESLQAEIARLREERLTDRERAAICWARAGLLNDAEETKLRGLRERSEHSREAAETLTRLLERQPLPPGPEGDG